MHGRILIRLKIVVMKGGGVGEGSWVRWFWPSYGLVDSVSHPEFEGGQDRLKKRWGQIDKVLQFAFDNCDASIMCDIPFS
jgi:hypothetical protein